MPSPGLARRSRLPTQLSRPRKMVSTTPTRISSPPSSPRETPSSRPATRSRAPNPPSPPRTMRLPEPAKPSRSPMLLSQEPATISRPPSPPSPPRKTPSPTPASRSRHPTVSSPQKTPASPRRSKPRMPPPSRVRLLLSMRTPRPWALYAVDTASSRRGRGPCVPRATISKPGSPPSKWRKRTWKQHCARCSKWSRARRRRSEPGSGPARTTMLQWMR
ncbi:hypothetical protein C8R46DRAFT_289916 [Mycena filopes]|nr:hypothetical protein C8R46DRAFT_289916 [Mycena filopes]